MGWGASPGPGGAAAAPRRSPPRVVAPFLASLFPFPPFARPCVLCPGPAASRLPSSRPLSPSHLPGRGSGPPPPRGFLPLGGQEGPRGAAGPRRGGGRWGGPRFPAPGRHLPHRRACSPCPHPASRSPGPARRARAAGCVGEREKEGAGEAARSPGCRWRWWAARQPAAPSSPAPSRPVVLWHARGSVREGREPLGWCSSVASPRWVCHRCRERKAQP